MRTSNSCPTKTPLSSPMRFAAQRFARFTLRTKLMIAFLLVALLPFSLSFYLVDRYTRSILTDNANQALQAAAAQTALQVDSFIVNNLNAIGTEAQLPDFIKYLNLPPDRRRGSTEEIDATLALYALSRKDQANIASYALLDCQGRILLDTYTPDIGADRSGYDDFQRTIHKGVPYASAVLFSETGTASIYFSGPVRDTAAGEIIGILSAQYSAGTLEQIIVQSGELAGYRSYAILLDENHVRLAHGVSPDLIFQAVVPLDTARVAALQVAHRLPPDPSMVLATNLPAFERALENAEEQPYFTAQLGCFDGELSSAAVVGLLTEPWQIVFAQPQAAFLAPVRAQSRAVLLLGLGVMVAVIAAAAGIVQWLTGPVAQLTAVARRVSAGDLDAKARIESADEVGVLAEAFNAMTGRLVGTLDGLRASEENYRSIFENAVEGIYRVSVEGQLLSVNPALARILAFASPDEALGQLTNVWEQLYVHPADRDHFLAAIFERGVVSGQEFQFYRRDGQMIWGALSARLVRDPAGQWRYIEGTLTDVTDRKRAEEALGRLNIELERRVIERTTQLEAAVEELETFSYTISHNLRAPLRHIDGFLALLQQQAATVLDEQCQHYLATVSGAARYMGQLTDEFLAFLRMGRQVLSKQVVDLNGLVHEAIRSLEPETCGRPIRWRIADLPVVTGDPVLLGAVLANLLSNALKFTRPRTETEIEIGSLAGDGEIIVFVRDNGVGFDMQYEDKLFGVFQRLHHADEFEGTGIGLASVRRIINRHGGRTWAEGEVDRGAAFYFSLPCPSGDGVT
ncbi:MAG: sensor histidine kinase [Chloroflexota bacterium]